MLYCSVVISKGFGHQPELLGEGTEGPIVKKVKRLPTGAHSGWNQD